MATKKTEYSAVVEEQTLAEGQFRVNVGDADREYIMILNQLINMPGGSFDLKSQIRRMARQLQAKVQSVTSEMYKNLVELNRLRTQAQRLERVANTEEARVTLSDLYNEIGQKEELLDELQEIAYAQSVVINGPKFKLKAFPKADNLAKAVVYQKGNSTVQTDYTSLLAIIEEEFIDSENTATNGN